MDARHLPGNWSSTANAIERQMFLVKDALFTLDDFSPRGSRHEIDTMHGKGDRVFRSLGNASARGRCWANGQLRVEYPPKCFLISSGEDRPPGESCAARRLDIHMVPGDIPLCSLTPYQQQALDGVYAQAMAGYIRWLAQQGLDKVHEALKTERNQQRTVAMKEGHPRTAGIVADLYCGWRFLPGVCRRDWGHHVPGGKSASPAYLERYHAGREQAERGSPVAGTGTPILGVAIVCPHLGTGPRCPCPAQRRPTQSRSPGLAADRWRSSSAGTVHRLGGWGGTVLRHGDGLCGSTAACRAQGEVLSVSLGQLKKRLDQQGFLASRELDKLTVRRTILGQLKTVLHLHLAVLDLLDISDPVDPSPDSKQGDSGKPGEASTTAPMEPAAGSTEADEACSKDGAAMPCSEQGESGKPGTGSGDGFLPSADFPENPCSGGNLYREPDRYIYAYKEDKEDIDNVDAYLSISNRENRVVTLYAFRFFFFRRRHLRYVE